jgi:hypothetical protein
MAIPMLACLITNVNFWKCFLLWGVAIFPGVAVITPIRGQFTPFDSGAAGYFYGTFHRRQSRWLVRWRVCEVKEMKVLLEPMFRLVVEGNRVAARQGGKQPETNHQTAGYELDSA